MGNISPGCLVTSRLNCRTIPTTHVSTEERVTSDPNSRRKATSMNLRSVPHPKNGLAHPNDSADLLGSMISSDANHDVFAESKINSLNFIYAKNLYSYRASTIINWKFTNIQLLRPIKTNIGSKDEIFLWKAKNMKTDQYCLMQIHLITNENDAPELLITAIDGYLSSLMENKARCLANIFSYDFRKITFDKVPAWYLIIVKESILGSLHDLIDLKHNNNSPWTDNELTTLICEIIKLLYTTKRKLAGYDINLESCIEFTEAENRMVITNTVWEGIQDLINRYTTTSITKAVINAKENQYLKKRSSLTTPPLSGRTSLTHSPMLPGMTNGGNTNSLIHLLIKLLKNLIVNEYEPPVFSDDKEHLLFITSIKESHPNLFKLLNCIIIDDKQVLSGDIVKKIQNCVAADIPNETLQNIWKGWKALLGPREARSQRSTETIYQRLVKAKHYAFLNLDKAISYYWEIIYTPSSDSFNEALSVEGVLEAFLYCCELLVETKDHAKIQKLANKFVELQQKNKHFEKILQKQIDKYIRIINYFGCSFEAAEDYENAFHYYFKSLKICKYDVDKYFRQYIDSLRNIAQIHQKSKDYKKALSQYKQYAKVLKDRYFSSSDHESDNSEASIQNKQELAHVYHTISQICRELGDLGMTQQYLLLVYELDLQIKATKPETILAILHEIADICIIFKDYINAIQNLFNALEITKNSRLANTETHSGILLKIAEIYDKMDDHKTALSFYTDYSEMMYSQRHSDYYKSVELTANCHLQLKHAEKALELYQKYSNMCKDKFGYESKEYIYSVDKLIEIHFDCKNFSLTNSMQKEILELKKKVFGESHQYYLNSINNLGETYFAAENFKKALEWYNLAYEERKNYLGSKHEDTACSLLCLALTYDLLGDRGKAMELMWQMMEIMEKVEGKVQSTNMILEHCSDLFDDLKEKNKRLYLKKLYFDPQKAFKQKMAIL